MKQAIIKLAKRICGYEELSDEANEEYLLNQYLMRQFKDLQLFCIHKQVSSEEFLEWQRDRREKPNTPREMMH